MPFAVSEMPLTVGLNEKSGCETPLPVTQSPRSEMLKQRVADLENDNGILRKDKAEMMLSQLLQDYQMRAIDEIFSDNRLYDESDDFNLNTFDRVVRLTDKIKSHQVQTVEEQDFIACHSKLVKKYGRLAAKPFPITNAVSKHKRIAHPDVHAMKRSDLDITLSDATESDPEVIALAIKLFDEFKLNQYRKI